MGISMTPLGVARIAGEVGLAGGTIAGGTCAAKYSSAASVMKVEKDKAWKIQETIKESKQKVVTNTGDLGRAMFLVNKFLLLGKSVELIKTELEAANNCLTQYTVDNSDDEKIDCAGKISELSAKVRQQQVKYTDENK